MIEAAAVVDLAFQVQGREVPADHGYLLYASIARHLPALHGDESIGIHPLRGQLTGGRRMVLGRESRLVLRLPVDRIAEVLPLAGRRLEVGGQPLLVGVPATHALAPAAVLYSRLVVIKGFMEPATFLEAVRRQLSAAGLGGRASLAERRHRGPLEGGRGGTDQVIRRTVRIRDREVVGFAVRVEGLSPSESVRLQALGAGGRRRFGCGIFVPVAGDGTGA